MNHNPSTGLLPVDESDLAARLSKLSLEQKAALLTGADAWNVPGCPDIGLAPMLLSDGPNGVRGERFNDERDPALLLPNLAALAATWDPQLLFRAGELLGEEARRKRVHVLLGPTVNIQRALTGGRNFENLSEDPLLTARLGRAYVEGVQSRGVAACPKHFVANDSETERFSYDVRVDERTLREIYLAPFEEATVVGGAATVMAAYNAVRGQTMTENAPLVEGVLKGEWAFDGVVLSDWMATRSTEGAALGGLDLAMPGPVGPYGAALVAAVCEGRVPEKTVDDKVLRLLRLAARVGALDTGTAQAHGPVPPPPRAAAAQIRDLTTRTFVLLRNEGLLPLRADTLRNVALIGPAAVSPAYQGGGSASLTAARLSEPRHALRAALPAQAELTVHRGVRSRANLDPLPAAHTRNPDSGEPGARLDYLDADGQVLLTENRHSLSLSWIGFPGVPVLPPQTTALRLRTTITAPRRGPHTFSVTGTGGLVLDIGGTQSLRADSAAREGVEDVMRRTPDHRVTVELDGSDTDITLTLNVALVDSPVQFIEMTLGHDDSPSTEDEEFSTAVEAARHADAVILMLGTSDDIESESFDRPTVRLPGRQDELAAAVLKANPDTVVVVNASSPVVMDWAEQASSLLWTFFGGQEYGAALADVLLGAAEPTGRLTASFPRKAGDAPVPDAVPVDGILTYDEGLLIGHRAYDALNTDPLFPFGHGTGYTPWTYLSAALPPDARSALTEGDDSSVRVRLRNTGDRPGHEVVQIYAEGAEGDGQAPPRQLVGFAVAQAAPGRTAEVDVLLTPRSLSRYTRGGWEFPDTPRRLHIGHSSRDLALTVDL
ncbi:beta-glucosidase [Streptomyces sp. NPDC050535]|uniref:beta-glucosidase n=1 Tax=Streptomyces sp. NPDC050535 TaxID=3365626 RepID=UPI00378FDAEA